VQYDRVVIRRGKGGLYWADASISAVSDEMRDLGVFVEDAGNLESDSPFFSNERGTYFRVVQEDMCRHRAGVSHNWNTREGAFPTCWYSGLVVASLSR